jgi:hypothetical protein
MSFDYITLIAFGLNVFLLLIIIADNIRIAKLKKRIEEECHKRLTPFLNLAIDREELALRLVNEGTILAQNITIADAPVLFDVGFQKRMLLRFKPIDCLKPGESTILNIEMLENNEPVPSGMMKQIGGVLLSVSLKAYVYCQNMNGISFCIEIIKEGANCKIKCMSLKDLPSKQKATEPAL